MNTSKLTARIVALSLAAASFACRQSGALGADSPEVVPAPPPAPKETVASEPAATEASPTPPPPAAFKRAPAEATNVRRPKGAAGGNDPFLLVPGAAGGGAGGGQKPTLARTWNFVDSSIADLPALLTTEAVETKVEEEWREDLAVMDKLVRDAVSGNTDGSVAMGIKLHVLGLNRAGTLYVEDAGVILSATVNWPLKPSAEGAAADPNRPRDPDSPWDRTKRQLKGYQRGSYGPEGDSAPPPAFDQKKFDDLIDDVLYVLPQATNFRHLKDTESVFVTISGIDDAGRPARLTMKAKKSDIDEAAAKKIDAATFKQRVSRRVG